jgi:hypothetical protein
LADVNAKAVIRADNSKVDGDLKKTRSLFDRAFRGIAGGIKGALSTALAPLGIGGAAGFAIIGKGVLDFESKLNRLQIAAGRSDNEIAAFRTGLIGLSRDTGISRDQLLGAVNSLVELQGTSGFSAQNLKVLAEASLATGESMDQLAGLTFALNSAFKISSPEDLTRALSGLITVGKEGAVPLTQMSGSLQKLAVGFSQFGVSMGPDVAVQLGAAMQVVRKNFGSAEEAATGVEGLMTALLRNSSKLGKNGVRVFEKGPDGERQLRHFNAILNDLSKLDQKELVDMLGRVEGAKAAQALKLFRKEYDALYDAGLESNALAEDAAKRRQSDAFKIEQAMNNAKEAIAKVFTPERVEKFGVALEKVAAALEWCVDHGGELAVVFGGWKLGELIGQMNELASASKTVTGAVGAIGSSAGSASSAVLGLKGGLVALAGVAGWKVGRAFAEATGSDDALGEGRRTGESSGFMRDRLRGFQGFQSGKALGTIAGRTLVDEKAGLRDAAGLLRSAESLGVLDPSGKVNEIAARRAGFYNDMGVVPVKELQDSIDAARALLDNKAWTDGLKIQIGFDQQGRPKATPNWVELGRSPQ